MSKHSNLFGHRLDWRFRPGFSIVEDSSQPKQKTPGDSDTSEPDKREASDQDESNYKRVKQMTKSSGSDGTSQEKKFKCPTEPFLETLRLIEELF